VTDEAEEAVDDQKLTANTYCFWGGESWGRRSSWRSKSNN